MLFLLLFCLIYASPTPDEKAAIEVKPGDPRSHHLPVEPHHSLRFPFDTSLQHWHYGGHAVATTDMIRLTPNIQTRSGWLFNEFDMQSKDWELELKFALWSNFHIGGDGMGIWILNGTMHPSNSKKGDWRWLTGPLFGLQNEFNGIGVIIDTYDNDGLRDNPKIFVIRNDGTKSEWGHGNDFKHDMLGPVPGAPADSNQCTFEVRQRGKYWSTHLQRILLRYLNGILHVYVDTVKRQSDGLAEYQFCLAVPIPNFDTTNDAHIAVTALTGQLADAHDLHQITLRYLDNTDDVIDDSILKRGAKGKMGYLLLILHILNLFILGYFLYDMIANHINQFHKIAKEMINAHFVCNNLNGSATSMYLIYFTQFIVFLLFDDWGYVSLNFPLLFLRAYRFMTDTHKVSVHELTKTNSWFNRRNMAYLEALNFFVLLIATLRIIIGI